MVFCQIDGRSCRRSDANDSQNLGLLWAKFFSICVSLGIEFSRLICFIIPALMTAAPDITIERRLPTRLESFVFRGKTALLQLRRAFIDRFAEPVARHGKDSKLASGEVISSSKTPLWTETEPEERFLVA